MNPKETRGAPLGVWDSRISPDFVFEGAYLLSVSRRPRIGIQGL